MASLMAILGLDGAPFKAGLKDAERAASATGAKVSKSLHEGFGGSWSSSGSIREMIVLLREMSRGNWSRVPGSLSILLQRGGAIGGIMKVLTSALGMIAGVITGIGIGAFAAYKLVGNLAEKLAGLKLPEFHPEYIATHLQKAFQVLEIQKQINKEIERAVELYGSAASAAKRVEDQTKEQFGHIRKMNEYQEEKELKLADTEEEKMAVRLKYANIGLQTDKEERNAQIRNKQIEQINLETEAKKKQVEANRLLSATPSKQADENSLKLAKMRADIGQAYLDESEKNKGKVDWYRLYNKFAASGVSTADIDNSKIRNASDARAYIKSYSAMVEAAAQNEQIRKRGEELAKEAGQAFAKAAVVGLEAGDLSKSSELKARQAADEAQAKMEAENASAKKAAESHLPDYNRNALQRIGAFSAVSPLETEAVVVAKQSNATLKSIDSRLEKMARGTAFGASRF